MNLISIAIREAGGIVALARECRVTHQAVKKWEKAGKLPRTEWTGETKYAEAIERATHNLVTKDQLLNRNRQIVQL